MDFTGYLALALLAAAVARIDICDVACLPYANTTMLHGGPADWACVCTGAGQIASASMGTQNRTLRNQETFISVSITNLATATTTPAAASSEPHTPIPGPTTSAISRANATFTAASRSALVSRHQTTAPPNQNIALSPAGERGTEIGRSRPSGIPDPLQATLVSAAATYVDVAFGLFVLAVILAVGIVVLT